MKISKVTRVALKVAQLPCFQLECINSSKTGAFSISCCAMQVYGVCITCGRYLRVHQWYTCLYERWMSVGLCVAENYTTQWSLLENCEIFSSSHHGEA